MVIEPLLMTVQFLQELVGLRVSLLRFWLRKREPIYSSALSVTLAALSPKATARVSA